MKKNVGDLVIAKEQSKKTTNTVFLTKEKYVTPNQVLARRDVKLFCKKQLMVKADIPPSPSKGAVRRVR